MNSFRRIENKGRCSQIICFAILASAKVETEGLEASTLEGLCRCHVEGVNGFISGYNNRTSNTSRGGDNHIDMRSGIASGTHGRGVRDGSGYVFFSITGNIECSSIICLDSTNILCEPTGDCATCREFNTQDSFFGVS